MIMLDTNICIYVLKERPLSVLEKFEAHNSLSISTVVYAELWSGIEKSPQKTRDEREEQLNQFFSLLKICAWDETAGREYARQHTLLQQSGQMIGNMDLLIAAHAKSQGATLVTNNVREFSRIDGLLVENWV